MIQHERYLFDKTQRTDPLFHPAGLVLSLGLKYRGLEGS